MADDTAGPDATRDHIAIPAALPTADGRRACPGGTTCTIACSWIWRWRILPGSIDVNLRGQGQRRAVICLSARRRDQASSQCSAVAVVGIVDRRNRAD
jgi:hypothetical protein